MQIFDVDIIGINSLSGSIKNTGSVSDFSGSFHGTSSYARYALSASWAPGGGGGGASGSSVSSSYALTASYFEGQHYATFEQTSSATTWSFQHNLNYQYPVITVWNSDNESVIPEKIFASSSQCTFIYFPVPVSGYASATIGSILPESGSVSPTASYALSSSYADYSISSSYAITASHVEGQYFAFHTQSVTNTTWSFQHNLNYQYPVITVWGTDHEAVIPEKIFASSSNITTIYFPVPVSGYASATIGSILPSGDNFITKELNLSDYINGLNYSGSHVIHRIPFNCNLDYVFVKKTGAGSIQVNVRKSGSSGRINHTGSNLILTTEDVWYQPNSLSDISYITGDSIEALISGSSSVYQLSIQFYLTRT